MKERTKKNALLDVARKMPPLHHKFPDKEFDWEKSAVMKWVMANPEIMDFVWRSIMGQSKSNGGPLVTYDPDTGMWKGVDYDGD